MIESLPTPPATPLLLGQVRETVKDRREWVELGFPVFADTADGFHEFRSVLFVPPRQNVDVGEVAPAGVRLAALDGSDDLLRIYHGERVSEQSQRAAEQSGQGRSKIIW